jgi:hypothetical protein
MVDELHDLGTSMTTQQLAVLLKVSPRTVRKYYQRWDGVEVAPGGFRFFENRVKDILNRAIQEEPIPEYPPGPRP